MFLLYCVGYKEDYSQQEMEDWFKKIGLFEPDIKLLIGELSMNACTLVYYSNMYKINSEYRISLSFTSTLNSTRIW